MIFDAVIKSKLLYGLETTELPKSCKKRLDAFQIKGLRKILGFNHTNWDRTPTNKKILETATEEAYRKGNPKANARNANKHIELFSNAYKKSRKKLLGHLIRTDDEDPLRQVSLQAGHAKPTSWGTHRPGKPRQQWVRSIMQTVWKQFQQEAPKIHSSMEQKVQIFQHANQFHFAMGQRQEILRPLKAVQSKEL